MLIWISVMWKIDIKICEYLDNKTISQKWCPLYLIIFLEIKNKKGLFTLGPKLGGSERGYLVPQGLHCLKNWGIIDFYVPYSQQNCLTSLQIPGKLHWYFISYFKQSAPVSKLVGPESPGNAFIWATLAQPTLKLVHWA